MDYHSHEAPNANTRGVIVDSVSHHGEPCIRLLIRSFNPQVMHELMVKCLPRQCRLTTIFDVSRINSMIWDTSSLTMACSLAILGRFLVRRSLMPVGF